MVNYIVLVLSAKYDLGKMNFCGIMPIFAVRSLTFIDIQLIY